MTADRIAYHASLAIMVCGSLAIMSLVILAAVMRH